MSMTKLRNKVSRNGFDLSRKNIFSAKTGEILPVACIEVLPGDSFDIDTAWFTRTQPVNTAAYTRMREYFDWYFVPTNLLWDKFNTFVTQMTDNNQKANGINTNVKLSDEHPYFTHAQVGNYIQNQFTRGNKNFFSYDRATLSTKLLHYLDYGDFSSYLTASGAANPTASNAKLNPFPLLAYQKVYQDFYRDSQWEKAYAPAANINYMTGAAGTNNIPLSSIDYANENMFDLRYSNWNKDYFMGLLPNSQYGDSASIQFDSSDLTGWFGLEARSNLAIVDTSVNKLMVDESTFNSSYPDGYRYSSRVGIAEGYNLSSAAGFRDTQFRALPIEQQQSAINEFTILALRQLESKQKWAEITQSNPQDYKAQMQAHFDVNVDDAYSDRCKYLGGISGNLDIEAVTNQNLADGNEADIAGRGQGGSRGQIKFRSEVHGYIMCMYHFVPLLDYAIDGIKRQNLKTTVFDYAIPEFDATGMVSVPLVELTTTYVPGSGINPDETHLGYAPRYIDYKTGYDLVHGAFFNGNLQSWVAPVDNNYINEYLTNLGSAIATGAFNYHFFKVPPAVLNPIFAVAASSDVSTDQVLVNCAFDIKAVRNLDRNGLPY